MFKTGCFNKTRNIPGGIPINLKQNVSDSGYKGIEWLFLSPLYDWIYHGLDFGMSFVNN